MNTTNQQDTKQLFELGLEELAQNHFRFAKKYFRKASSQGHKHANRFLILLCCSKDKTLARDLILCAERRI